NVAVAGSGSTTFPSTRDSFHDGLGFSTHCVISFCEGTNGLLGSITPLTTVTQSLKGAGDCWNGKAGSQPGLVAAAPGGVLNCGRPSKVPGMPFCVRHCCNAPK